LRFKEEKMLDKDELFYRALELFTDKGTKFTMDELAKSLGISKRTLYENVRSKEDLSVFVVERYFEIVEERQRPVREDASLEPVEKLRRLLTTTPTMPRALLRMDSFRVEYRRAYALLDARLTEGWENTFRVMDEAVAAGKLRPFDKELFARLYASGIEGIITDFGSSGSATFNEMQSKFVDILLFGITA
jgi:AcrR family transcriptional regulator